jgi:hypothetical protein
MYSLLLIDLYQGVLRDPPLAIIQIIEDMNMELYIQSNSVNSAQLHKLSLGLLSDINAQVSVSASIPKREIDPTAKGDPITIGQLALTFLSGGSAVALLEVIKAYVARNSSISIELKDNKGGSISFSAENINSRECKEMLDKIQSMSASQE